GRLDGGVLAVDEGDVRFRGFADTQIHLQPCAVRERSEGDTGRVFVERALHGGKTGGVQTADLPAGRLWVSWLRQYGDGAGEMDQGESESGAGVRGCEHRRVEGISLGRSVGGEQDHQARQPGNDRRCDRAGARETEIVRRGVEEWAGRD